MSDAADDGATAPLDPVAEEPPAGPEPPAAAPRRRRVSVRALLWTAALLLAVFAAVLVWLLYRDLGTTGADVADPRYGIEAVREIGGPGIGARPRFAGPLGVAYGPESRIYVADSGNNRIVAFSRQGRYLFEFGEFGVAKPIAGGEYSWKPGRLNYPTGIDVDENGDIYVADFRNDQIQVFDEKGRFLRRFPDPGKVTGRGGSGADGLGIAVTDVCVKGGFVYATDTYQVFVFTTDGRLIRQFGRPGGQPGDLDHPNGIAVGDDGTIYVSDSNHNRVTAFTPDGTPRWNAGTQVVFGQTETDPDGLGLPRGLAVTTDGSILVADPFDFEIVRITPEGRIADRLGSRGSLAGQVDFPNDVDTEGDLVVIADRGNDRVQVVRLVARTTPGVGK